MAVHRVPGVDGEVEYRVLDLARIYQRVPQSARNDGLDFDLLAQRATEHVLHSLDEPADVDDLRLQRLTPAEGEQLRRQLCSPRHSCERVLQPLLGALVAG